MVPCQTAHRGSVPTTAPVPLGPGNPDVDFFAHGACTHPSVDPALFTAAEEDEQAVAAARAVCRDCPVRLPCRSYAYQTNPYGVYAAETQAERTAKLDLGRNLAAQRGEGVVA